jgi:FKBP-type peptidyl-prolyl cis-trans isomerase FkpA
MTEITRVPLQPIGKGSLGKLWAAIAVAVLLAAGVAWAALPETVNVQTIQAGTGPSPQADDLALVNYTGLLPDGKQFDKGEHTVMPLDQVVPGFAQALRQMQKGGKYRVEIPAKLAYGAKGAGPIPPNTDLTFNVELLDFISKADYERQMSMLQQMQQMQQQPPGASPHGAPIPPPPQP